MANLLNISPSTIEKWEQQNALDKDIKLKYWDTLTEIYSKVGTSSKITLGTTVLIAPLTPGAGILGGALSLAQLVETKNLERTISILNDLKELSKEEREKFIGILFKLN